MSSRRILLAVAVILVIVAFLYLAAGALYWDWGLLPAADRWVYAPRAWWPLAVLAFLLSCIVLVLLRKHYQLEARLAELERRQAAVPPGSAAPVGLPPLTPSSTAIRE